MTRILRKLGIGLFVIVGACLASGHANAYPGLIDGAALKSCLESAQRLRNGRAHGEDVSKAQFAYGYLAGIVDALNTDKRFFCQPSSITPERDAEIVLMHMNTSPAMAIMGLHENATLYVFDALGNAFPCKG